MAITNEIADGVVEAFLTHWSYKKGSGLCGCVCANGDGPSVRGCNWFEGMGIRVEVISMVDLGLCGEGVITRTLVQWSDCEILACLGRIRFVDGW